MINVSRLIPIFDIVENAVIRAKMAFFALAVLVFFIVQKVRPINALIVVLISKIITNIAENAVISVLQVNIVYVALVNALLLFKIVGNNV